MIPLYYLRAEDDERNDYGALIEATSAGETETLWRAYFEDSVDCVVPQWIGVVPLCGTPGVIPWDAIEGNCETSEPEGVAQLFFLRADDSEGNNFDVLVQAHDSGEAIEHWRTYFDDAVEGLDPIWVAPVPMSGQPGTIAWDTIHTEAADSDHPGTEAPR